MAYTLALHRPEVPLVEEWRWETDVQVAYDGSEERLPLLRYPRRTFVGSFVFTRKQDITRQLALMFSRFGTAFKLPLEQYRTKLKAPAPSGTSSVRTNALRGDLRAGREALIREDDTWEVVEIADVSLSSATFAAPLVNSYAARAWICPLTIVHSATNSQIVRKNPDDIATASFRYMENEPWTPFVSPLNDVSLSFFDGKAVLERVPLGTEFQDTVDSGIRITDYLNLPDFYSPWGQSQIGFSRSWNASRTFDLDDFLWWQKLFDLVRGSSEPFLLPSYRKDLDVVTPAAAGGSFVRVAGDEYSQHYFGKDTFARVVIASDQGRHYASVVGVTTSAGNDRLEFSPPLPAGAEWASNQHVEFLLKVRIADDMVQLTHYETHTQISLALRTIE